MSYSPVLAGRVAVVTGAGTGIGFAITAGCSVTVRPSPWPVSTRASCSKPARSWTSPIGRRPSPATSRPTLEHTEDTLQSTINGNLWTTLRTTLAVLPGMAERGYGRIVSIGAESVRNGLTDHAVYNAAKGGVHGFATGLAREFAKRGVTVNVVAPSYTRTDALDAALDAGRVPERLRTVVDDAVALIPLGQSAEVDDIVSVNGGSSMS